MHGNTKLKSTFLRIVISFFPFGKSKYVKLGNNFYAMLILTDFSWFTIGSNRDRLQVLVLNLWNALAAQRLSVSPSTV